MRISDWSSDVCSSDLLTHEERVAKTRRDLGFADEELVVGTVGRIVAEKGYRELFQAARSVRQRFPAARFLVVGERDPDKRSAERRVGKESVRTCRSRWSRQP